MIGMTVCSGIGAPEVAAPFIDWRYQSEIEAFPCAVLKTRFPHATNLGDMTKFKEWPDAPIDILVGGTPCQSFSVAGLRKGMADPRGNLALVYLAIADRYRPQWLLWENVPGVLSSNGGRDFGAFLGGLAELGYGFAYRVLDAQFVRVESHPWAVPQRRRRVFVVGHLGDWRRAAAVLFERESLSGHSPPRREAGQGVAGTISSRPTGGGGLGTDFDLGGGLIEAYGGNDTRGPIDVATARNAHAGPHGRLDFESETFVALAFPGRMSGAQTQASIEENLSPSLNSNPTAIAIQGAASRDNPSSGPDRIGVRDDGAAYTLEARQEVQAVAFDTTQITSSQNYSNPKDGDPCHPLAATAHPPALATSMAVRRLTPLECERLQGFPDGHTAIEYRSKPAVDGPRYKAIGNSMAVNVMNWLLGRIYHFKLEEAA